MKYERETAGCRVAWLFYVCVMMLLPVGLVGVAGCEKSNLARREHTILVVGSSQSDPLWPVLQGGARAYARTVGGLKLTMLAPAGNDASQQADLVRRNLDRTVAAVCLQVIDGDVTGRLVQDLGAQGISVVCIGKDLPDTNRIGYVGLDDQAAGRLLAEAMRANMHDRTTFMVLHGGQGAGEHEQRLQGFGLGMLEIGHLRELRRWDCEGSSAKAQDILREQGRRYPDLGMWVSLGDWPASIQADSLRQILGEKTGLVTIGALPAVWPLIEQGLIRATVATNYGWWGYEAVSLAELAFRREQQPDKVRLTPPCILTSGDLAAYRQDWAGWAQGEVSLSGAATRPWRSTR